MIDVYFSEGTRQQLEAMRQEKIHNAAALIQAHWRGLKCRIEWITVKPKLTKQRESLMSPKPQSHKYGNIFFLTFCLQYE